MSGAEIRAKSAGILKAFQDEKKFKILVDNMIVVCYNYIEVNYGGRRDETEKGY